MPHDAVAAHPVRARLVSGALADDAEPVRVVDVQDRVVRAREAREGGQIGHVPRHAVDAVDADEPGARAIRTEALLELVQIVGTELLDRGAARRCELTALVDRLVGATIDEDGAARCQHRDHGHVDQRDRRQDERVLAAEELREAFLDLLVQHRAAEQP